MKSLYSKCLRYIYQHKSKSTSEYSKITICSKFIIYILPTYQDDVLIDVKYECIGSILHQVYLDVLLGECIGKTRNEIASIIRNVRSSKLEYIVEINSYDGFRIYLDGMIHKLVNLLG
jgi:NifU-like protein involved in Fe-S cluster formation